MSLGAVVKLQREEEEMVGVVYCRSWRGCAVERRVVPVTRQT
jgi:hypothetical protein